MKDIDTLRKKLIECKDIYLNSKEEFDNDYAWGICNGIELALSLLEERPAFLVDKKKQHNNYDINSYPEYFL
jgi:hypothetical protein